MLLEAFSFSFNLSLFTCLVWSILTFQNIRLIEKIKKLPLFILFSILFYATFYLSSFFHTKIFEFKSIYFNGYTILILILLLGFILFVSKRSLEFHAPILSIVFAPYFFFLLFGFEEFSIFEYTIPSYSLLKTQNPMIGLCCIGLLFIKPNKILIPTVTFVVGFLFYYITPLKEFPYPEIRILHYKYIPHEFFLRDNLYLFEENSGIYTEKKADADDVLYKFTMRPIKKINLPLRQDIQSLISKFEFPILLVEDNAITLLELSRKYNHSIFKVTFQIQSLPGEIEVIGTNSGFNKEGIKIEGPIF